MNGSSVWFRGFVLILASVVVVAAFVGCEEPKKSSERQRAVPGRVQQREAGQPGAPAPQSEGEVLARIGDITITESDLEQEISDIPVYMQTKFKTKSGKLELLNKMVENELLARAAEDAGLDKDPEVARKIEDSRKKILQNEYYRMHMKDRVGVPDSKIQEYYEANKDEYKTKARARVRIMILDNDAAAKKTLAELQANPEKFEQLAKERSKDEATAQSGGLLGWVTDGGYIRGLGKDPDVNKAIFALTEGQMSDVVKTRKGEFAILKVESMEPETYRPLDEVKRRIADDLLVNDEQIEAYYNEHKDEFISQERVKARIIVLETEKSAAQAKKDLSKGLSADSFGEYAKKNSIDKTNARNGGYLGYITRGRYIPGIGRDAGIEEAIFALDENQISNPIKTKKGWSIFYIEKKEASTLKPLDRVKTLITNKLRREMRETSQKDAMDSLKEKYNCQVFEDKVTGPEGDASGDESPDRIREIFDPR